MHSWIIANAESLLGHDEKKWTVLFRYGLEEDRNNRETKYCYSFETDSDSWALRCRVGATPYFAQVEFGLFRVQHLTF